MPSSSEKKKAIAVQQGNKSKISAFPSTVDKAMVLKKSLSNTILKKITNECSQLSTEEIKLFRKIITMPLEKLYNEFQTQIDISSEETLFLDE